jgi:hypothetical protein
MNENKYGLSRPLRAQILCHIIMTVPLQWRKENNVNVKEPKLNGANLAQSVERLGCGLDN